MDINTELIERRFKPLNESELKQVNRVFVKPFTIAVLVSKYNVDMTKEKLSCLRPGVWLNDEVINFYMNILKEKNDLRASERGVRPSWYFSSFFMEKLLLNGCYSFKSVKT